MPVPLYTPSNFAMIAGDEMSASNNIPVAFGYYAEFAEVGDIMNLTASTGSLFFGLRRDGSGTPLTGTEKQQPSATLLLPRGTIILINGKATPPATPPPVTVPYILYVVVTSEAGADTTYESIYSWLP